MNCERCNHEDEQMEQGICKTCWPRYSVGLGLKMMTDVDHKFFCPKCGGDMQACEVNTAIRGRYECCDCERLYVVTTSLCANGRVRVYLRDWGKGGDGDD